MSPVRNLIFNFSNGTKSEVSNGMSRQKKSVLREWVESLVIAAFLAFCIVRPLIAESYKIPTGSMRPTLLEGDLILVNKFTYGARFPFTYLRLPALRQPKRGEVIVFKYPADPKKNYIKRLVAFAGEYLEIKKGTIYINDKPLLDPVFSQRFYYNRGRFAEEGERIVVPKDSYFVLGDNSASSLDSRFWGFVPHRNLQGKAVVIWWPPNRIRIIR